MDCNICKALMMVGRVFFGSITMSTMPRIAAWYGVAKLSMYSSVFAFTSGSFLKMMLAAPAGPITAISAVGHAITWSAPKS